MKKAVQIQRSNAEEAEESLDAEDNFSPYDASPDVAEGDMLLEPPAVSLAKKHRLGMRKAKCPWKRE